jgi:hypothetical protein
MSLNVISQTTCAVAQTTVGKNKINANKILKFPIWQKCL